MKKEKEITIDKIHQAGFDRENFVTSSPKKKFLFPLTFSIMFLMLYFVWIVSTNILLKKHNIIPSDNSLIFFTPPEIFKLIVYLVNIDPILKLEFVMYYLTPFAVLFLLTAIVLLYVQNMMKSSKPTGLRHGSARFDTDEEVLNSGLVVRDLGEFYKSGSTGVSLGMAVIKNKKGKEELVYLIEKSFNEHILCYAPSRSGKGVGLVIPSLLLWRDSSITLDPKGENWDLTSGWLSKNGHKCIRLDLGAPYFRYNPLSELKPTSIDLPDEVRRMVGVITSTGGKGGGDNKFFEDQAKDLLTACLTYLIITYHSPNAAQEQIVSKLKKVKPNITLYDLAVYLSGIDPRTGATFEPELDEEDQPIKSALEVQYEELALYQKNYLHHAYIKEQEESFKQVGEFIEASGRKFLQMAVQSEKTFSNIVSSADQNLAIFKLPIIKSITSISDFKLKQLVDVYERDENDNLTEIPNQPTSLFLVNPPKDELTGKTDGVIKIILQNLFISVLYETGLRTRDEKNPKNPYGWTKRAVLCMLDEFPKLGKFEIMEKLLADAAGYGAKFYLIAQSDKQINQAYDKENSIFAGTQHKVIYRPADIDTAKSLSEILGNYTYVEEVFNVNDSGGKGVDIIKMKSGSKNWSESQRALMTPEEIYSGMKDDHAIILSKSHKIYGRKLKYYEDPYLKECAKIPAPKLEEKSMSEDYDIFLQKLENKGITKDEHAIASEYARKLQEQKENN